MDFTDVMQKMLQEDTKYKQLQLALSYRVSLLIIDTGVIDYISYTSSLYLKGVSNHLNFSSPTTQHN